MADLVSYGNAHRDVEQALIALKKGAHLLKYGRKGKPKFCPFRLSHDESSLIWISGSGERSLKLASVSRIIPGQRTAVFRRYLRPEKDYLSFSLIYNNGKRSLDLICKDKVEAEVWIAGIRSLISSLQGGRLKIDGWSDGGLYLDDNRDLASNSASGSSSSAPRDFSSPDVSISSNPTTSPKSYPPGLERSYAAASDQTNMQLKGSSSDAFRVSISSAPSTSSHGSGPDDSDSLGDVYIWGEVICDNVSSTRTDVLLPRPLESNLVLDVTHIACGVRHAALVTRQGELFTWGEESGGRLGHGVGKDATQPHLVESLSVSDITLVACGEFHTCAVTSSGEMYTWGDGTHNVGLLGHGTDVSHWIPKRISGPLDGLQVASVTCGPWHTALITSTRQLFTFGDGTFGVLGHGDRENVSYPKEVESLSGLRTVAVACGVWHTAAVVDVMVTQFGSSVSSGKLFTWGDGDKNRLGHGDKESRLKPTCVPGLIDYNFHKVACGHSLTVGLTTAGHVYTMGSTVYGQLGNPEYDGKLPCLVEGKLVNSPVEDIACGAYHVTVLTSKNEVYTWGKGANGRLGHGDVEDRKTPTIVESLNDRHVKFISCGSNYTAAICVHKWVSGAEQSQCSSCRQAFGFTRKRHNCYNCGLVHCHSCSSKKAPRAALAPNPGKPYRVCDSCFTKLSKMAETGITSRRNVKPRLSGENKDRLDKAELKLAKSGMPSNHDLIKLLDNKAAKQGKKGDAFLNRSMQGQSLMQLKDVVLLGDFHQAIPKPINIRSGITSRSVSPISRKPSPPRSATPVPTTSGLSFSKGVADSLKKTNELLNQEVLKLRGQVDILRHQYTIQETELKKSRKAAQEAMVLAAEESAKCKASKDVIKSLTAKLKDMAERLPPGSYDFESIESTNGMEPNGVLQYADVNGDDKPLSNGSLGPAETITRTEEPMRYNSRSPKSRTFNKNEYLNGVGVQLGNNNYVESKDCAPPHDEDNDFKPRSPVSAVGTPAITTNHVEAEWIEQYEPGVYITLVALRDGTRDLKRVRFSRRRFGEHQAETWWSENREHVYERYNVRGSTKSSVSSTTASRRSGESVAPPAKY
ncbi:putative regulator of chromosome condensation 1/beta-lactamase-inhibitor protein II [Helianthus annuus]|uniref:Regulator of chromosome condensation 1/beta-lactamase-inhibitor protein II n=1 Tax=Helianthus annuus TaxID=4232 RepID=A0A251UXZ4_HELAN|nr:PH, RCC1 and FYVE domains-containing protein 1 [Helianthus annuus]XP_022034702.1 PH, RCC1 and FYVE domains-containing protein 1 [Helianthus annuus]KAF5809499.1 putative regulator of chromosome condensation 1/beta-lactamase-inhibitor protein II [Helianthus annuus]